MFAIATIASFHQDGYIGGPFETLEETLERTGQSGEWIADLESKRLTHQWNGSVWEKVDYRDLRHGDGF